MKETQRGNWCKMRNVKDHKPWSVGTRELDTNQTNLHFSPIFCYPSRFEACLVTAFLHVLPFSRGVRKVRMPAHWLMRCPVTGWDLVGCHVPRCPHHRLLPIPSPLAHHWAKISHCCPSDARPRTQPLIKGTHWLTGDASPKSTWFWATETKEWG